jgi:hypothetical protein
MPLSKTRTLMNDPVDWFLPFRRLKPYEFYYVNRTSNVPLISKLIKEAENTNRYTIASQTDMAINQPAVLLVEFIQQEKSIFVLFELFYLPKHSPLIFGLLIQLFRVIFDCDHTILSWGNAYNELPKLVKYGLFTENTVDHIYAVNVQYFFKAWYDNRYAACLNRSYKNIEDKCSVQKAMAIVFNEFQDETLQDGDWSMGLDLNLGTQYTEKFLEPGDHYNELQKEKRIRQILTQYAIQNCFSITKLAIVVENNCTKEEIENYNDYEDMMIIFNK